MGTADGQGGATGVAAIGRWAAGLDALPGRIAHRFGRAEVRARARRYLAGLLGPVARRNGWLLAEHLGERHPRGVLRLLDAARWDADAVRTPIGAGRANPVYPGCRGRVEAG